MYWPAWWFVWEYTISCIAKLCPARLGQSVLLLLLPRRVRDLHSSLDRFNVTMFRISSVYAICGIAAIGKSLWQELGARRINLDLHAE